MAEANVILSADNVTKRFGAQVAVNDVTYRLHENEIAGIIGSNGAGKTTFFNLLTGYFKPTEGQIRYRGEDVTQMAPQQRVALGMMRTFQLTATFDNLTVLDNLVLAFFRAHRQSGLFRMFTTTRRHFYNEPKVIETLETFDLADIRNRLVQHLSLGEKRRLEIAMSVIAEPTVLLLDEPPCRAGRIRGPEPAGGPARPDRPADDPHRRAQTVPCRRFPGASYSHARGKSDCRWRL